jgi:ribulose-phosphate 3-epimerase
VERLPFLDLSSSYYTTIICLVNEGEGDSPVQHPLADCLSFLNLVKRDMKKLPLIAPSILSADFSNIAEALERIEASGADMVHLDVMDGRFVPNITFGPKMVSDIKKRSSLPLDVHLMIVEPEKHIEAFIDAGADYLTFHIEAAVHAHRILEQIRSGGAKPGISLVPSSPGSSLSEIITLVDLVLVMTVNPGYGGQKLIPECLEKLSLIKAMAEALDHKPLLSVDGGINGSTAASARKAGASLLVSGSAFFSSAFPEKEVSALKGSDPEISA